MSKGDIEKGILLLTKYLYWLNGHIIIVQNIWVQGFIALILVLILLWIFFIVKQVFKPLNKPQKTAILKVIINILSFNYDWCFNVYTHAHQIWNIVTSQRGQRAKDHGSGDLFCFVFWKIKFSFMVAVLVNSLFKTLKVGGSRAYTCMFWYMYL
jgi:hypothetical protein